jgi:hypothetical protein
LDDLESGSLPQGVNKGKYDSFTKNEGEIAYDCEVNMTLEMIYEFYSMIASIRQRLDALVNHHPEVMAQITEPATADDGGNTTIGSEVDRISAQLKRVEEQAAQITGVLIEIMAEGDDF